MFVDCLRGVVFFPCKSEPNIWMRHNGEINEYIDVYVDDLEIMFRDHKSLMGTI